MKVSSYIKCKKYNKNNPKKYKLNISKEVL